MMNLYLTVVIKDLYLVQVLSIFVMYSVLVNDCLLLFCILETKCMYSSNKILLNGLISNGPFAACMSHVHVRFLHIQV